MPSKGSHVEAPDPHQVPLLKDSWLTGANLIYWWCHWSRVHQGIEPGWRKWASVGRVPLKSMCLLVFLSCLLLWDKKLFSVKPFCQKCAASWQPPKAAAEQGGTDITESMRQNNSFPLIFLGSLSQQQKNWLTQVVCLLNPLSCYLLFLITLNSVWRQSE